MGRQLPRQRPGADRRDGRRSATGSCATSGRRSKTTGMTVPMATTNLFTDPVFKDGAFTAHDARVRALRRCRRRCGPWTWAWSLARGLRVLGRPRGRGSGRGQGPGRSHQALPRGHQLPLRVRPRSAATTCGSRSRPSRTSRAATSTSPPPAPISRFIDTLDHPEMVGVNPEVAHEQMAGLNFLHAVAQALEAGKLFHIDLNDQKPGRFDQDLRFGSGVDQGAVLPRQAARGIGLRRTAPLRRARLPDRGRRRRLGLRARLHAHLSDSQEQGTPVCRGH